MSTTGNSNPVTMDIHRILRLLPHRYPFLLVDKVIECTPGESLVAVKNVTYNEPFFTGHFPIKPVMPGKLRTLIHREADAFVLELGIRSLPVPIDLKAQNVLVKGDHLPQVADKNPDHVETSSHVFFSFILI